MGGGEIFNFAVGINGGLLEKVEVEELKMSRGGVAKSSRRPIGES